MAEEEKKKIIDPTEDPLSEEEMKAFLEIMSQQKEVHEGEKPQCPKQSLQIPLKNMGKMLVCRAKSLQDGDAHETDEFITTTN